MWNIAPYGNHEDLYTIQDNLSKVHGNHTFKTGFFYGTMRRLKATATERTGRHCRGNCSYWPWITGFHCMRKPTTLWPTSCCRDRVPILRYSPASRRTASTVSPMFTGTTSSHTSAIPGRFGAISRSTLVSAGPFIASLTAAHRAETPIPAYNDGGNYPNQWANWSLANWSAAEAAANPSDACNGTLIVPGTTPCANAVKLLAGLGVSLPLSNGTPGPNSALVQQNNHSIAPRVGIAWDVRGDGKTAVRAGGGQFFQREPVGLAERLARNAPFVINATTNRSLDTAPPLASPAVSPNAAKTTNGYFPTRGNGTSRSNRK